MKRYPHYKDSGVAWLGEVPQHWVITSFKRYCDIQLGKMLQPAPNAESDMQVSYLKAAHVQWQGIDYKDLPEMWISLKDLEKFQVQSGDLLVCEGGEVGRSAILGNIETPTIIQNALHRIRGNKNTFVPFVNYMLRHIADSQWFEILCNKATIAHLTGEKLGDLSLALPPLSEQQAIAAWLDGKTAQIDTLIRRKQTLLEKLAEKRGALISHAVTKGLNPAATMKDSGVAWLGDVPQHWAVKRLRFVMNTNPSKSEISFADAEVLVSFVPMEAVGEDGSLLLNNEKELGEISGGYTYFAENDVVVAKITPCFENGKGAIAHGLKNNIAFGTTELHVMRASVSITPEYLFSLTMSYPFRQIGESEMYGAGGQKRIPESFLKNFAIGIPPVQEQQSIAAFLDSETARLDAQRQAIEAALAKLQEYRSALISHAVTGKIDIRELSAAKEIP